MVRLVDDNRTLTELTRALVDALDPDRIILFGSRARGDAREDSDYDLAVEVDAPVSRELADAARDAATRAAGGVGVDVKIRRTGQIDVLGRDPGYIDWDIVRQGIVVYSANRPLRVREAFPPPEPSWVEWMRTASVDLRAIDALLAATDPPWEAVGFHAQQAAEKYIKAALVRAGLHPNRSHDLGVLVNQLSAAGAPVPDLASACATLLPFAVAVRYPEIAEDPKRPPPGLVTRAEGERAVAAMRSIIAALGPAT